MDEIISRAAKAMSDRRQELIAQPLSRIWEELAKVAIEEIAIRRVDLCRAAVDDEELARWAETRADDAGRLARELIVYRRVAAVAGVSS